MTKDFFLSATVVISLCFLVLDLLDKYFDKSVVYKEKFKFRSFLFLLFIIALYGTIQYLGLLLVPQSENIINFFRKILPPIAVFDFEAQSPTLLIWITLGIVTFYISGFWDYVIHRFFSHHRKLFFTHEYHHLPNELFLALPGLSVRPFVVITVLPATIGTLLSLCVLLSIFDYNSIPLIGLVYFVIFVQTIILAATHSSFFIKQKRIHAFLKYTAITTPQEHELHHTVDLRGNYGNFTTLWDKIFGTYIDPSKVENQNHKVGLPYDQDYLGAITGGKFKFSKKFREYFQIDRYCNMD